MDHQAENGQRKLLVILNPAAGNASVAEVRRSLSRHFAGPDWQCQVYQTTGQENVVEVTRQACQEGVDLVVAAGGDGTVVEVMNGAVHTGVPLGIIPVGTGNGLARALGIPLELEAAMHLLSGSHTLRRIDAMQVEDRYYTLTVSAGVSSRAMQETEPEYKRRFGILAYVWLVLKQLAGWQPHRFNLVVDGRQRQFNASEILVSNVPLLEEPPFPLGPPEKLADRRLEAYVITARNALDYLRLLWSVLRRPHRDGDNLRHLVVQDAITIEAVGEPQPVQADGDLIGQTPVTVRLAPAIMPVVVPAINRQ